MERREYKYVSVMTSSTQRYEDPFAGSTGLEVWRGAEMLSRYLEANPVTGRVVELGAGTGLPGLTAAKLGARVTLTDQDPQVLELLRHNVQVNGLDVDVRRVVFGDAIDADVVLAADILYLTRQVKPLRQTLRVVDDGAECLFAHEMRRTWHRGGQDETDEVWDAFRRQCDGLTFRVLESNEQLHLFKITSS
ncbi:hypothetical protein CTAYLR_003709 [Chrysophaeum taylorii]|uniref:Uncharacterized protein n=1 Tax=Chrysophaeum taylorii TaxID=2483200 RepID=A0AAD7UMR7_9STRA|nr:hypothetical protein CTAYLR_003709 [Chrysophaeum taylorii]